MRDNDSERNARQRTITITVDEVDDRTRAIAEMDWHDLKLVGVGRTRPGEEFRPGRPRGYPSRARYRISLHD